MRLVTWEECMNRHAWPLVLAGATLVLAGCGGREEREEEASESAAQEQRERAQTERPFAPIDWKQVDAGLGAPARLAAAVHAALALTTTPFSAPAAAAPAQSFGIDTAQIAQILGYHGKVNGGVYQVGVPRAEKITADGIEVPTSMGLATAINFQPTGGGKAAITGDFVLLGNEVNPVIRALRDNGSANTALHSHMLTDSPHLFFMHYWANDDALKLAHGLRAALDKMNVKKV